MPLYLSEPGNTGMSSLDSATELSVEVDVITLDEYAERTGARPDLVKIDAAHSAAYEARARAFRSSGLRTYDRLIAQIRAQFAGTPIGASESIMSPMAAALGLRMMTPARFLDGEEPLRVTDRHDETAEERATETRDEPRDGERGEFRACRGDGQRGSGPLVLAYADDRAANARPAQMADEDEDDHERREHEVVVVAVEAREVDRAELAAREFDGQGAGAAGEERLGEDVLLGRDRERHRADREQQTLHA